ncbi:MAG: biotin--[acetyl-CoA-carboxylase] ligase [Terriglobia bacterium]|jgi:BirA family biotin operon repressor/biotin-[acetyl-CoA-carboxylase] ligase
MAVASTERKIDKMIDLLVKNATVVVPGPKIAAQIGVTRAAVSFWVKMLRTLGVEIKSHHGKGYQLLKMPDLLVPAMIREELRGNEIGQAIVHHFRIDSTNTAAMVLAQEGAAHGTVVVAEEQTAGRGRFGREWYSEKSSGIYLSVILRPPFSPTAAPILTLMAGVAAQQAVSALTGLGVDIRWPNDLLVNGKKVAGILTEMKAELGRLHAVVLGIGINVNHSQMPASLKPIATSLRIESQRPWSRVQICVALLKELERHYHLLLGKGSAAIAERWAAASSYACAKRIRIVSAEAESLATTTGLDPSGALRVRYDDGREEALVAGEVSEVK